MINNSSFGFSKCGLNHRARRMQSSLLELAAADDLARSS